MAVFSVTVNPIGTTGTVASQFENFAGAVPVTGLNGTVAINAFTTPASPFGVYALPVFFPGNTPDNRVRIVGTTNGETINASLIDPAGETSFPRGNNLIFGNAGDDTIFGGAGTDFISGGDGADSIVGGAGADTLNGDLGNDTIVADLLDFIDPATNAPYTTSNPRLSGGDGFDVLVLPAGTNPATVSSAIGISIATDFERIFIGSDLVSPVTIGFAGDVTLAEGNGGGNTNFTFTVNRSSLVNPGTVTATLTNVTTNAADFAAIGPFTVTFPANSLTTTVTVPVIADGIVESDEQFTLTLTTAAPFVQIGDGTAIGTIVNDDALNSIQFANPNLALDEGNAGVTNFTFTLIRTGDVSAPVGPIPLALVGAGPNPANAADFGVVPANVSFAAGQEVATITVPVIGDTTIEPNEGFTVTFNDPLAGNAPRTATGTILTDDVSGSLINGTDNGEQLNGTALDDIIRGFGGADTLDGGAGDDQLDGGAGSDEIKGGLGADVLTGGSGADTFIFNPGDSPASAPNIDVITDFAVGVDKIKVAGTTSFAPGVVTAVAQSINQLFGPPNIGPINGLFALFDIVQVNVNTGAIAGTYLVIDSNGDNVFTPADDIISLGSLLAAPLPAATFI